MSQSNQISKSYETYYERWHGESERNPHQSAFVSSSTYSPHDDRFYKAQTVNAPSNCGPISDNTVNSSDEKMTLFIKKLKEIQKRCNRH